MIYLHFMQGFNVLINTLTYQFSRRTIQSFITYGGTLRDYEVGVIVIAYVFFFIR